MNSISIRNNRGFTMIEVIIAGTILTIALLGLLSTMLSASTLQRNNRESTMAQNAVAAQIEIMHSAEVRRLPDFFGPGTTGATFTIPGLDPVAPLSTTAPRIPVGSVELFFDETLDRPDLGLPRDLNSDGDMTDTNIRDSRLVLVPARVSVRWQGINGVREITAVTLLCRR